MTKLLYSFLLLSVSTLANERAPTWQSSGPRLTEEGFFIELPIEIHAKKIYLNVHMGGKPRRFLLDTGSPSMISATLVSELDLEVIGLSKGIDSHGTIIESEVVQAEFSLGGVQFQKVPMFAADFSSLGAAQCLLGDGILGSEVLPLCAWQIDLPSSTLRCASDIGQLDHIRGSSKQRLYNYGYPHTPFVDIQLSKNAKSKAMFDTGSAPLFVISPPDLAGAEKAGGISNHFFGVGSAGTSLGGQAPVRKQHKVQIEKLAVGKVRLGQVNAIQRARAPSLLGASLLEQFIVTLDSRADTIYLDRYRNGSFIRSSFGFALSFEGGTHVSLVWEDSPAAEAGLELGQRILSLNGTNTELSCGGIQESLKHMEGDSLEIEWEGGKAELTSR